MPGLRPMTAHPLRQQLNDEVHSRPSADVHAPMMVTQISVITGETGVEAERALLRELAEEMGVEAPGAFGNHLAIDLGTDDTALHLVWERHTEFSTYAFSRRCSASPDADIPDLGRPFSTPPLSGIPESWRARLPGEVLVGINLLAIPGNSSDIEARLPEAFGDSKCVGAGMSGGRASAWTDFQLHEDGMSRIIVANQTLRPGRLGRLIQRLLDVETYRMMALLAFPLARDLTPDLGSIETELSTLAAETARIQNLEDEQRLLAQLSTLAARAEDLAARSHYRFSAARAYHQLVERRISELDEVKREGLQQIGTFMERRLGPAMRTCTAVADRLEAVSVRISRASSLLNTRVEVALQEQNQSLLRSMEGRARLQLRLQETVEGLSAVAITYYLVGLIAYVLKALEKAGQPINPTLATGVLAPFVLMGAYIAVRQIRKRVTRNGVGGDL
ncbi:DUF3422 domain-containing protein [Pyruvatibacter sp.]|uniref:DUF3422 family protein n=1 Tax=Pyruvatibacter sp. TaxID=1981328 RepID=UPI00326372B4